jgi:hypothetical protein
MFTGVTIAILEHTAPRGPSHHSPTLSNRSARSFDVPPIHHANHDVLGVPGDETVGYSIFVDG